MQLGGFLGLLSLLAVGLIVPTVQHAHSHGARVHSHSDPDDDLLGSGLHNKDHHHGLGIPGHHDHDYDCEHDHDYDHNHAHGHDYAHNHAHPHPHSHDHENEHEHNDSSKKQPGRRGKAWNQSQTSAGAHWYGVRHREYRAGSNLEGEVSVWRRAQVGQRKTRLGEECIAGEPVPHMHLVFLGIEFSIPLGQASARAKTFPFGSVPRVVRVGDQGRGVVADQPLLPSWRHDPVRSVDGGESLTWAGSPQVNWTHDLFWFACAEPARDRWRSRSDTPPTPPPRLLR